MTLLQPSSSAAATALAAVNSMGTTAGSTNAQETDIKKGNQLHLDGIKQDQTAADLANSPPSSIVKKRSTAVMKPDIGILSKDFLKNKGKEKPIDKQFAIHRKKRVAAKVDVDVGILDKRRRRVGQWRQQQTLGANLHDKIEVTGRSLQSEWLPYMCPGKKGYPGYYYFGNLFNKTDSNYFIADGYFPKCSCPSPTTCGPNFCECLELDANGDVLQCMDSLNQLCEGTMYIDGVPGPWSMEQCLGDPYGKFRAIYYCSYLPCFVDGGSMWQCRCNTYDSLCTEFRDAWDCAKSTCCQAQTDDEGRKACIYGGYRNYYDQVTSFTISGEEMISRFNECSFNSDNDKSIVQCYCESFSYGLCVNYGVANPDYCEAMNCCFGETEDDARLDCFTNRFRTSGTGYGLYLNRDAIQESCVASGKSGDQCKCDIQGLSNCVGVDFLNREPKCDLFQCCQSQTDDNDEGRKDCLVQEETQLSYETCISDGNTTESCYCDKSITLCSSGNSNDRHCELSSCCQEQAGDTGRRECIGNFTTSQPSFAPSSESIPPTDASPASSPSTGNQVLGGNATIGTPPNYSNSSVLKTEKLRKALVVAAVIGWLLLT